jgi:hypothetical protein
MSIRQVADRELSMQRAFLVVPLILGLSSPALSDAELRPCDEAGIGLTTLVQPVASNQIALYEGKVILYNVDTIEPACCSAGLAVVLPDKDDPLGGSQCFAVIGLGAVDVTTARRSYDPARGLLVELATSTIGENGERILGETLHLRINLADTTVRLER